MSPTIDLFRDYSRFAVTFFDVISTSSPHIYHSALSLSPKTSKVHETYKRYAHKLTRVVHGLPVSWEQVVATTFDIGYGSKVAWSPCSRFIAVAKFEAVEIRDAATLNLLSTFKSPLIYGCRTLNFSPDGRFLAQSDHSGLVSWDLQTGCPVATPSQGLHVELRDIPCVYSTDGKMLAAVYHPYVEGLHSGSTDRLSLDEEYPEKDRGEVSTDGGSVNECCTFIATHDLSTTRTRLYHASEGYIIPPIWTHGESLRFAAVEEGHITIWEAAFTSIDTPEVVEAFPVPHEVMDGRLLFLPTRSRLAITSTYTVSIWDLKASRFLLNSEHFNSSSLMSFSLDGRFFACGPDTQGFYVWKESPTGYTLHRNLCSLTWENRFSPQMGKQSLRPAHPQCISGIQMIRPPPPPMTKLGLPLAPRSFWHFPRMNRWRHLYDLGKTAPL